MSQLNRFKLTVFTPTFNRLKTLERLYISLTLQTNNDFIWLIVDDGSTDETSLFVEKWINGNIIQIEYVRQTNHGKSYAHNVGVTLTKTELFTCVDSDDYLTCDAIEIILSKIELLSNPLIIGILAFKCLESFLPVTNLRNNSLEFTTLYDAYNLYGLTGDVMLIYKTDIIKKCSFPVFENEKFVPEAYLYDLLDKYGRLNVIRKSIYICEYLEDGYSKNISQLLLNNPRGYIEFLKQRISIDKRLHLKLINIIKLSSFYIAARKFRELLLSKYIIFNILTLPFSYIISIVKYGQSKKKKYRK